MRSGSIESTRYLRNPLDVLAQQIVAMAASRDTDWPVAELAAVVRRCACYADLTDDVLGSVLDLLAGRYPSEEFGELRPRIVWDRIADTIRAREGARRLAVTSGGTIPDRGLFGVFLPDGTRVGELDEEMVYESRAGDTFLLGASSWRIEDITFERVVVTPAPGVPGKMPFWHGDRPGRPLELGRALGAFVREVGALAPPAAMTQLQGRFGLDERAANNVVLYLNDQREATGVVPDDRTVVVERFRDEIGDWRVCILTPFGTPVHAPWAMAIEHRLAERHGLEVETMWSDDGIVVRLPEAADELPVDDILIDPDDLDELVVSTLPRTAMFSARFRECAARSLLLPRRRPDKRTPLWQQRQRASDLLAVASKYPTFPILLETTRECIQDVFDVPALREVLTDLRARKVRLVGVDTAKASPFAQSLLFNWIATYMYEGDAPIAERRAAALALDRDLLRELLGAEELRELIDPGVLADLELELQCLVEHRQARSADEVHDLLRRLGDLSMLEVDMRVQGSDAVAWIEELIASRRAVRVRLGGVAAAGDERIIAADDASRYRDALGVAIPVGLPAVFTDPVEHPLEQLIARYARTHGPFLADAPARRFGIPVERVLGALRALESDDRLVRGEFRPDGIEREWCDADVLRQLRRRSLARLRHEVEPVEPEALARFLPGWQGVVPPGSTARRPDALVEAIGLLQGLALPVSVLEADVLAARVPGYRSGDLDALCTSGEVVWVGAGGLGARDGRVRLYFRDQIAVLGAGPIDDDARAEGVLVDAIRAHLAARGASFWNELRTASADASDGELIEALYDLVWSGEVTNDSLAPLRAHVAAGPPRGAAASARPTARARPRPGRLSRLGPAAAAGRWSLVSPLLVPAALPTVAATALAQQLLERHGVLTREAVLAEGVPGGFTSVYGVLKVLEERGQVRRGYFVAGLGAAQFATPGAVDRLRAVRDEPEPGHDAPLVLAATDPAQPYGAALAWPAAAGRPARTAGALVVQAGGRPLAWLDRKGRSLVVFLGAGAGADPRWAAALAGLVDEGRVRSLDIRRIDGEPITASAHAATLRAAGFQDGYHGLVRRR
jgi:ATP-dependent Lhr-like helicase